MFKLFYVAFPSVLWLGNPICLFESYQYLFFEMLLLATFTPWSPTVFLLSIILPLYYYFHFINVGFCFVNIIR